LSVNEALSPRQHLADRFWQGGGLAERLCGLCCGGIGWRWQCFERLVGFRRNRHDHGQSEQNRLRHLAPKYRWRMTVQAQCAGPIAKTDLQGGSGPRTSLVAK